MFFILHIYISKYNLLQNFRKKILYPYPTIARTADSTHSCTAWHASKHKGIKNSISCAISITWFRVPSSNFQTCNIVFIHITSNLYQKKWKVKNMSPTKGTFKKYVTTKTFLNLPQHIISKPHLNSKIWEKRSHRF